MPDRITRVYTRTGDTGTTGLAGGQRVPKDSPRIEAYGTSDELMSLLGWVREELLYESGRFEHVAEAQFTEELIVFLANKLFTLGGDLATRIEDRHPEQPVIREEDIVYLEKVCDRLNGELEPLRDFVLPGGSRTASGLHLARTVARRAERAVVALARHEETGGVVDRYLNRLSDLLFVLARWVNLKLGVPEVVWDRQLPAPNLAPHEPTRREAVPKPEGPPGEGGSPSEE